MSPPTCQHHALLQALLEATVLAAIPLGLGHLASAIAYTGVYSLVLYRALEEPFAPVTQGKGQGQWNYR